MFIIKNQQTLVSRQFWKRPVCYTVEARFTLTCQVRSKSQGHRNDWSWWRAGQVLRETGGVTVWGRWGHSTCSWQNHEVRTMTTNIYELVLFFKAGSHSSYVAKDDSELPILPPPQMGLQVWGGAPCVVWCWGMEPRALWMPDQHDQLSHMPSRGQLTFQECKLSARCFLQYVVCMCSCKRSFHPVRGFLLAAFYTQGNLSTERAITWELTQGSPFCYS